MFSDLQMDKTLNRIEKLNQHVFEFVNGERTDSFSHINIPTSETIVGNNLYNTTIYKIPGNL